MWLISISSISIILLSLLRIPPTDSFSAGAPSLQPICRSMTPFHGVNAQTSPAPYKISLDKTMVEGGDVVKVTLEAKDKSQPFRGFLAMGRKVLAGSKTNQPHKSDDGEETKNSVEVQSDGVPFGHFVQEDRDNSSAPAMTDITDCFGQSGSSITHSSSVEKYKVVFFWQAPNVNGNFVISVTFVQSRPVFWVQQPSHVIKVKRSNKDMRETEMESSSNSSSSMMPSSSRVVGIFHEIFKHVRFYLEKLSKSIMSMF